MEARTEQILLIEDEGAHAELIQRAFVRHQNRYELNVAASLAEARAFLENNTPNLVISDLLLPDGRGTELLQGKHGNTEFPLIVITSHGNEEVVVEAMKAGAMDYVVKSETVLADMPHIVQRSLREWDHIQEKKQAEEKIRASLREKELMLKEIHHRVKNNLQVISSLLRLQARQIEDKDALRLFKNSQNRVLSMALVHEKLYQSDNFSRIDLGEYIRALGQTLLRNYAEQHDPVQLKVDIHGFYLGVDYAVPCALVINELLSNAIRHAFPKGCRENREVHVALTKLDDEWVEIVFRDNGIGMPESFDFKNVETLGLHLVQILVDDQLMGNIHWFNEGGTCYKIRFKNVFA